MSILALDLGTKTGWALAEGGCITACGTEILATSREITAWGKQRLDRRRDPRIYRLFTFLKDKFRLNLIDLVVFEDVLFVSTRKQAHLWASFRTAVWLACPQEVRIDCLDVQRLKKFAVAGGAAKEAMVISLSRRWPDYFRLVERNRKLQAVHSDTGHPLDDNAVDAVWLALWAQQNYR